MPQLSPHEGTRCLAEFISDALNKGWEDPGTGYGEGGYGLMGAAIWNYNRRFVAAAQRIASDSEIEHHTAHDTLTLSVRRRAAELQGIPPLLDQNTQLTFTIPITYHDITKRYIETARDRTIQDRARAAGVADGLRRVEAVTAINDALRTAVDALTPQQPPLYNDPDDAEEEAIVRARDSLIASVWGPHANNGNRTVTLIVWELDPRHRLWRANTNIPNSVNGTTYQLINRFEENDWYEIAVQKMYRIDPYGLNYRRLLTTIEAVNSRPLAESPFRVRQIMGHLNKVDGLGGRQPRDGTWLRINGIEAMDSWFRAQFSATGYIELFALRYVGDNTPPPPDPEHGYVAVNWHQAHFAPRHPIETSYVNSRAPINPNVGLPGPVAAAPPNVDVYPQGRKNRGVRKGFMFPF